MDHKKETEKHIQSKEEILNIYPNLFQEYCIDGESYYLEKYFEGIDESPTRIVLLPSGIAVFYIDDRYDNSPRYRKQIWDFNPDTHYSNYMLIEINSHISEDDYNKSPRIGRIYNGSCYFFYKEYRTDITSDMDVINSKLSLKNFLLKANDVVNNA